MEPKNPIINCHTHIFTKDHVPPFLAKTFVPWPFYFLLYTPFIIQLIRIYKSLESQYRYNKKSWVYRLQRSSSKFTLYRRRHFLTQLLYSLVIGFLIVNFYYHLGSLLLDPTKTYTDMLAKYTSSFIRYYSQCPIKIPLATNTGKVLFLIACLFFFKSIRKLFFNALKLLKFLPGKKTIALFGRYLEIGEYAKYSSQNTIYKKALEDQYPKDTKFIVLPMDMAYMEAGHLKKEHDISNQMRELAKTKKANPDTFLPFVFADPRRMQDPSYFAYEVEGTEVILTKGCTLQIYLEEHDFAGIKLYPALGYYPFDEVLLPLYKYAAARQLPIMTHCIRGTIFYRGQKKKAWDYHPIFEESEGKPLFLKEVRNIDFCNNFTHPLNYLCLLDGTLLHKVVAQAKEQSKLKQLFPSVPNKQCVQPEHDLSTLKICFAHFGGEDQWATFLEKDRYWASNKMITNPGIGLNFLKNTQGNASPYKVAEVWKYTDWYSIISSILLQYKQTYADISYIVHSPTIVPLLKWTINYPILGDKVLFGTDFYVVRNHHSDKELLLNLQAAMSEDEFDKIARTNPLRYVTHL